LTTNFPKLHKTHILAKRLADGVVALGGKLINPTETNMVWINLASLKLPVAELIAKAEEKGLTVRGARVVVHHQIEESAIDDLLQVIEEIQAKNAQMDTKGLTEINEDRPQEKLIGAGY
jgi:threonine aldolase